jgi:hypothetical protein
MSNQRIIGIVLLVAGAILFIMGMNASDSLADRWSNFFTGHFTDTTVWYLVGGAASAAVGFIMMSGRRVL